MPPKDLKPNRGLTKPQAVELAEEFVRVLQHCNLSSEQPSKDQVATLVAAGLRFLNGKIPLPTENTPAFLRVVLDPLTEAATGKSATADSGKQYAKDLADFPESGAGLIEFLSENLVGATPEAVVQIRKVLEKLTLATSDRMIVREQLVGSLNKNMRGKSGPAKSVERDDWDRILTSSNDLRPTILKILEFAEDETREPLTTIINSVAMLHPEWSRQCTFLKNSLPLIERALQLAKVKRAKTRGKATKLADCLACRFADLDGAPSYSLQQVEQIRRALKKV